MLCICPAPQFHVCSIRYSTFCVLCSCLLYFWYFLELCRTFMFKILLCFILDCFQFISKGFSLFQPEKTAMSAVNITNVSILDNPAAFLNPFQFEISYECLVPLKDGKFTHIYRLKCTSIWLLISAVLFLLIICHSSQNRKLV